MKNQLIRSIAMLVGLLPILATAQTVSPDVRVLYLNDKKTPSFCENDETIVFFVNGLNNILTGAEGDRDTLKERLTNELNSTPDLYKYFGKPVFGLAYAESVNQSFIDDVLQLAAPDLIEGLNAAQALRWSHQLPNLSDHNRQELYRRYEQARADAIANSPANIHAPEYNRLIDLGRPVLLSSHSWGTITSNISYFAVELEENEDAFGVLPVALMDDRVEGGDRFANANISPTYSPSYSSKIDVTPGSSQVQLYTTIDEDQVAKLPRLLFLNTKSNVDNFVDELAANDPGHGYTDRYFEPNSPAEHKIITDLTHTRLHLKPEPCHGISFAAGGSRFRVAKNEDNEYETIEKTPASTVPSPQVTQRLIDWRGRYRDDPNNPNGAKRPTRTLSWMGPSARYNGPWTTNTAIYRDGRVAYAAPAPVLGAAIQEDADGVEWIIAVVAPSANSVAVYRRYANYIPGTGVGSWDLLIGNLPPTTDFSKRYSPWMFNGEGTQAKALRLEDQKLYFDEQPESIVCVTKTDPGCGHDAGDYTIQALIEYTLNTTIGGSSWSATRSDLEYGGSAILAVDYIDSYPVYMKGVNTPLSSSSSNDLPATESKFIDIISTEPGQSSYPMASLNILDCSLTNRGDPPQVCRGSDKYVIQDENAAGIAASWRFGQGENDKTDLHVQYADIRTGTFVIAKAKRGSRPEYWLIHKGVEESMGSGSSSDIIAGTGLVASQYGPSASIDFLNQEGGSHINLNPILGQYQRVPNRINGLSAMEQFDIAVDINGDVFVTGRQGSGSYINYSSAVGGPMSTLDSFILANESLAPLMAR